LKERSWRHAIAKNAVIKKRQDKGESLSEGRKRTVSFAGGKEILEQKEWEFARKGLWGISLKKKRRGRPAPNESAIEKDELGSRIENREREFKERRNGSQKGKM